MEYMYRLLRFQNKLYIFPGKLLLFLSYLTSKAYANGAFLYSNKKKIKVNANVQLFFVHFVWVYYRLEILLCW